MDYLRKLAAFALKGKGLMSLRSSGQGLPKLPAGVKIPPTAIRPNKWGMPSPGMQAKMDRTPVSIPKALQGYPTPIHGGEIAGLPKKPANIDPPGSIISAGVHSSLGDPVKLRRPLVDTSTVAGQKLLGRVPRQKAPSSEASPVALLLRNALAGKPTNPAALAHKQRMDKLLTSWGYRTDGTDADRLARVAFGMRNGLGNQRGFRFSHVPRKPPEPARRSGWRQSALAAIGTAGTVGVGGHLAGTGQPEATPTPAGPQEAKPHPDMYATLSGDGPGLLGDAGLGVAGQALAHTVSPPGVLALSQQLAKGSPSGQPDREAARAMSRDMLQNGGEAPFKLPEAPESKLPSLVSPPRPVAPGEEPRPEPPAMPETVPDAPATLVEKPQPVADDPPVMPEFAEEPTASKDQPQAEASNAWPWYNYAALGGGGGALAYMLYRQLAERKKRKRSEEDDMEKSAGVYIELSRKYPDCCQVLSQGQLAGWSEQQLSNGLVKLAASKPAQVEEFCQAVGYKLEKQAAGLPRFKLPSAPNAAGAFRPSARGISPLAVATAGAAALGAGATLLGNTSTGTKPPVTPAKPSLPLPMAKAVAGFKGLAGIRFGGPVRPPVIKTLRPSPALPPAASSSGFPLKPPFQNLGNVRDPNALLRLPPRVLSRVTSPSPPVPTGVKTLPPPLPPIIKTPRPPLPPIIKARGANIPATPPELPPTALIQPQGRPVQGPLPQPRIAPRTKSGGFPKAMLGSLTRRSGQLATRRPLGKGLTAGAIGAGLALTPSTTQERPQPKPVPIPAKGRLLQTKAGGLEIPEPEITPPTTPDITKHPPVPINPGAEIQPRGEPPMSQQPRPDAKGLLAKTQLSPGLVPESFNDLPITPPQPWYQNPLLMGGGGILGLSLLANYLNSGNTEEEE